MLKISRGLRVNSQPLRTVRSFQAVRFQSSKKTEQFVHSDRVGATGETEGETNISTPKYTGPVSIDRDFPDPFSREKQNRWYFVCYGLGVILSCAAIFNYEKTTSPIITSTFFILRRSTVATELLGPTVGYSSSMPWISGPLNTVQGKVDISFGVKGEFGKGKLELKAQRQTRQDPFIFEKFLLIVDGKEYDLRSDPAFDFSL